MESLKPRVLLTVPGCRSTASPYREMLAIAKFLPRHGFEVTVCSLIQEGVEEAKPILKALGCDCFVAKFRPRRRNVSHVYSFICDQKEIQKFGPFHIQYSLDYTTSFFEALAARMHSRFYVFCQRNMFESYNSTLITKVFRTLFIKIKILLAHKIIPISIATKMALLSYGAHPEKMKAIYNGIDFQYILPGVRAIKFPYDKFVLSVGQIESRKRHEDAIKTLEILLPDMPTLRLLIIGKILDGGYYEDLIDLIKELDLTEKVKFVGPQINVPEWMQGASVLLHCPSSEAFGWVIIEAMVLGLPVVSSKVDGPKEIIRDGETGVLVPCGDCEGYAFAVRKILNNPNFHNRIISNALEDVRERFSAEKMVEEVAKLFKELINKRH